MALNQQLTPDGWVVDIPPLDLLSTQKGDARYGRKRKPTIIPFGDSRIDNMRDDVTRLDIWGSQYSWLEYGLMSVPGGSPLDIVRNAGISGNTTAQMSARLYADVIAYQPGFACIMGGTNDGWSSAADVDASYARMAAMIDQLRAAGIFVYVVSETTSSSKGANFPAYVARYNVLLAQYVAANDDCVFWDFNSVTVDTALASGFPKTAMLRDGLHPSTFGAATWGKLIVAPSLAALPTRLAVLPCSQLDTQALNAASKNVMSNPLLLGTGGTLGSGNTGVLPDGWVGAQDGGGVFSTPARANGAGNNLHAVYTNSTGGATQPALMHTFPFARLNPGKKYSLVAGLKITSAVNVSAVSLLVRLSDGTTQYVRCLFNKVAVAAGDSLPDLDMVVRSMSFVAPSIAYTFSRVELLVTFAGNGSVILDLGQPALYQIN